MTALQLLCGLLLACLLLAANASAAPPVIQLDAWGPDSVRIRIAPAGAAIVDPPYSPLLLQPAWRAAGAAAGAAAGSSRSQLTQGNLLVQVSADGSSVSASRVSDGLQLFASASITFGPPAPGSSAGAVSGNLTLTPGGGVQRLLGMGEHRYWGALDVTGLNVSSSGLGSQYNTNAMVPFVMAQPAGWGLLWALPSYGQYSLLAEAHTWGSFACHNLDFWVTTTPAQPAPPSADPATASPLAPLLANLALVVGHAAPMPPYVAGFWQCKNRYSRQSQLLEVARGYVNRSLPIDIITIDYMHWPSAFGDWHFDPACWPDPAGMVAELRGMGIELAVTFWAHAAPAGSHFAAFNASGYLAVNITTGAPMAVAHWASDLYLTNQFQAAARAAIFQAFRDGYGRHGVRTLWLDGAEPERDGVTYGQTRYPGAGTDNEVGMAWVQQHLRAFAEGFAADGLSPSEFFLLPRSTWAGASRYSAGMWSGDISSTFEELQRQVVVAQAVGLSGIALWTDDAGGYSGGDSANATFQALIVRWLQASAFFPIMRLHGLRAGGPPPDACGATGGDNEVWALAKDAEHYEAMAALLRLRRQLVPYTLQLNAVTVSTGLPMLRPMLLAFPGDAGVAAAGAALDRQWMYGPDLLVAPVLEEGAVCWRAYLPLLPEGSSWVYHWNATAVGRGGGWAAVDTASIAHFPLFRREPPVLLSLGPGGLGGGAGSQGEGGKKK